jgi:DNA-binding MarR family transcriptional regulator
MLDGFIEGFLQLMMDRQTKIGEPDLTLVQAQALKLLRSAPLPANKLAGALGISAPALSQLTDRLERKNLIERRTVNGDRRGVMVALTEKGGLTIDGFRRRRIEVLADTLRRLSDEDRDVVIGALSKVAAVLEAREQLVSGSGTLKTAEPKTRIRRTAVGPPEASKQIGEVSVSLPIKRRMRIEWD